MVQPTVGWVQWIDGTGNESGSSIATDPSGNVYVIGNSASSFIEISGQVYTKPFAVFDGAFVVKYDTSGNVKWVQWIDGAGSEQGYGITTNSFGDVYVTGYSATTSGGIRIGDISYDKPSIFNGPFVIKYNTSGNVKWVEWIVGAEYGFGITTDSFGDVYVTGFSGTASRGIHINDISYNKPSTGTGAFVVKYDTSGDVQWVQWIDGTGSESGYGITSDSFGNIYVTGQSATASGGIRIGDMSHNKPSASNGAFVVKYDTSGAVKWVQWIDGTVSEYGYGITTDLLGNIYVTGYSNTIAGVIRIGDMSHNKPSADYGAFVVKYDTSGNVKWVEWIDGASTEYGYGITTDLLGNIYVTVFSSTISGGIRIGDISYNKPSAGFGAFVVKYDTSGDVKWVEWIDGAGSEIGNGITADSLGNIYVTGSSATASGGIRIGDMSYNKPSTGNGAFVVKYNTTVVAPVAGPNLNPVSILLPIQVDFNQFGDITVRVEGEDVSYNYDLRLHYYSKVTDVCATDLCNNVFKYNESTVSDALTDVSCSAPATLKALIKTALDASDISCAVPRKVYNLSGDMALNPLTDNSSGLLTTRPALMKDYLRGWLYTHLYDIIGLAATTGSIDLDMSGFSEYISESLKTQLCSGANGAAVREFIFKAMFVQDPARFQNASGSSTAPDFSGQTLANKDLLRGMPFKAGDSLSFLIKFNFPKGNIKAPVQSTVLRLGTTTTGITVGEQTNITVSTKSLSNTIAPGDLFRDFRQCLVWLQVHIEH
jgi:hypothetical protein